MTSAPDIRASPTSSACRSTGSRLTDPFVRDIPEDPDDVAIVQAILAMAKQLKIRVVAEGVETPAQVRFLRDHRCEEAQGYAFSRPLPPEACADFLAKTPLYAVASR